MGRSSTATVIYEIDPSNGTPEHPTFPPDSSYVEDPSGDYRLRKLRPGEKIGRLKAPPLPHPMDLDEIAWLTATRPGTITRWVQNGLLERGIHWRFGRARSGRWVRRFRVFLPLGYLRVIELSEKRYAFIPKARRTRI